MCVFNRHLCSSLPVTQLQVTLASVQELARELATAKVLVPTLAPPARPSVAPHSGPSVLVHGAPWDRPTLPLQRKEASVIEAVLSVSLSPACGREEKQLSARPSGGSACPSSGGGRCGHRMASTCKLGHASQLPRVPGGGVEGVPGTRLNSVVMPKAQGE